MSNNRRKNILGVLFVLFFAVGWCRVACAAGITIGANSTIRTNNASTIRTVGDWINNGTYTKSTGTVVFNGTISATLNPGSDSFNNLTLNKTSAADANDNLTVSTNALTVTGTTTITDGELIQGVTNFTLAGVTIAAAGAYTNESTGNLILSSNVSNAGTITFDSSGGGSGDADSISISSSVAMTTRDWAGTGTFSMTDVTVTDQTANSGTPTFIFVTNGTNVSGNVNWLFNEGALSSLNIEPASLIAGAEGDVTASFTLDRFLPADGKVVIDFGSGFNATGLTSVINAAGIDGTWAVSLSNGDGTNDVVTLTRQNDGTQTAAGTAVSLILEDEIRNPLLSGSTGVYAVSTQTSGGSLVDSGTASADTISSGSLGALSVTPADLTVGALVDYTIAFTPANPWPADGKLVIEFPQAYLIDAVNTATSASDIDGTMAVSLNGNTLTITRSGGSEIVASTVIDDLMIGTVRNPKSPGVAGDITLTTTNSADTAIDTGTAAGATFEASDLIFSVNVIAEPTHVRIGELVTFTATIENISDVSMQDFNFIHQLPAGMVLVNGTAKVDGGTFNTVAQEQTITFNEFSAVTPGMIRTLNYQAVVGSGAQTGVFASSAYVQINPVISNTLQLMLTINPDPVFQVGTLIGKVFWDKNMNQVQDADEPGIPNAVIGTEQGYLITTDAHGRYSVKDFLSGRHMLKLDTQSLPDGAVLTTNERVIVNQTDAMLIKVNFGVVIPDDSAGQYGVVTENNRLPADITVTKDQKAANAKLELYFHSIVKEPNGLLSEWSDTTIRTGYQGSPTLPIQIDTNYRAYIDRWEMVLFSSPPTYLGDDLNKIDMKQITRFEGRQIPLNHFPLKINRMTQSDPSLERRYFVEVYVFNGKKYDKALYELVYTKSLNETVWTLLKMNREKNIKVKGTVVTIEGKTEFFKRLRFFGEEILSDEDGRFTFEQILPEGEHALNIEVYLNENESLKEIKRHVRLGDTHLFFVGFSEYELGQLSARGNVQGLSEKDRAQMQSKWYDEGRLAFYLKGKIKGKYLIEASVDTDREKAELFRNLDPEDYYAVYGDSSTVTANANDTQDRYYVLIESDEMYFKYGNFNTGFSGTGLSDFNRTLHGAKFTYESNHSAFDGKSATILQGFWAKGRQRAAHDEFKSTGGGVYYLKFREVIRGSEKIKIQRRDKISGTIEHEKKLEANIDYTIDYFDGRIRLLRPVQAFTFDSDTITSTEILDGDRNYLTVDYEYDSQGFQEDTSSGVRVSKTFLGDKLRIGTTQIQEERALERYQLSSFDGSIQLPLQSIIRAEYAQSTLQASNQHISSDGGLTFAEVNQGDSDDAGHALSLRVDSNPMQGMEVSGYYQKVDTDFSSSGSVSQTGAEKTGFSVAQELGRWGEILLKYDEEKKLSNPNQSTQENTPIDSGVLLAQYRIDYAVWNAIVEYRNSSQNLQDEELIAAEISAQFDPHTTFTFGGQYSAKEKRNNQAVLRMRRQLSGSIALLIKHRFGSDDQGTQLGLDYQGNDYFLSKGQSISSFVQNRSETTEFGVEKNLTDTTKIGAFQGVGGTRSVKLSKDSGNGSVTEWVQEDSENSTKQIITETQTFENGTEQYSQSTLSKDKENKEIQEANTRGIRYRFHKDRGTIFVEDEFSMHQKNARRTKRTGAYLRPNEHTLIDFNYERYTGQSAEKPEDVHTGSFGFKSIKASAYQIENIWSLKMDASAQDTLQLLSAGLIEYRMSPNWTALGRYEWSWTKNKLNSTDIARFSEIQTGFAYRPIHHDRFNMLMEYKYLNDEPTASQITSLSNTTGNQRHVIQSEFVLQLTPRLALTEKFALRQQELRLINQAEVSSLTALSAHRLEFKLTDYLGLSAEYRILGSSLSDDIAQGVLVEGMVHLTDGIWVAVGYDFSDFNSDLTDVIDVQSERFYMRFFYDFYDHGAAIAKQFQNSSKAS